MRVHLQSAYCIHSRLYRETSQITEMLTPEHGLISCICRGARKQGGSAGLLFSPLLISWSGKGDLFTLTHVEAVATKQFNSPSLYIIGMYMNELILRLVPKLSPSKEIFHLYENIIAALDNSGEQENILRLFELELLTLIGHGLALDKEMDHETPIQKEGIYRYDVGLGPNRVTQGNSAWNVITGATLLGLQSPLNMDETCLAEAKRLMRGIINLHLADRPLRSREILQFIKT